MTKPKNKPGRPALGIEKPTFSIRLKKETLAELDKLAADADRTRANLISHIVESYVRARKNGKDPFK